MATLKEKQEILDHWNSKKIVIHRNLLPGLSKEIDRMLKFVTVEDLKESINFYATILEPGVPEADKKYFWSHKWNLQDFLHRGFEKFDGQDPEHYLKWQKKIDSPTAIVFKRTK